MTDAAQLLYMSAKQVADYLDLNEKKVYAMAKDRILPATKVTGKWLFPKVLIDRWVMDSCHSGLLNDRLIISGSDDPLLSILVARLMGKIGSRELVSYSATGSRLGLELLAKGYADVCTLHWGDADERHIRHPSLLKGYPNHQQWILVQGYKRNQGLIVRSEQQALARDATSLLAAPLRWVGRQRGAGSQQHLEHWLMTHGRSPDDIDLRFIAYSERELGGYIARGDADIGLGCEAVARETGLSFIPLLSESFDLVMPQSIYFRRQLQALLAMLTSAETRQLAAMLGGYSLNGAGQILWAQEN